LRISIGTAAEKRRPWLVAKRFSITLLSWDRIPSPKIAIVFIIKH